MYENSGSGATNGGAGTRGGTGQVKEQLRAARDAAREKMRGASTQARAWSRSRFSELQDRVEADPYRAAVWALGIGFVAGILLTALTRGRR
jgi:ElaB/YqjD/DUF883 family membrane-anchored ribosome-binding protein